VVGAIVGIDDGDEVDGSIVGHTVLGLALGNAEGIAVGDGDELIVGLVDGIDVDGNKVG